MPRGRPAETARLDEIVDAATRVFIRLGYRRTRMVDVARELGCSPGSLYTYVASKEALFHLAVAGASAVDRLPVPTPAPGETVAVLRRRFEATFQPAGLADLATRPVPRTASAAVRDLTAVLAEMYDALAANHRLVAMVERSAADLPAVAEQHYHRGRREYLDRVAAYLRARVDAGVLAAVPDVDAAARYAVEAAAWFAYHRHDDPDVGGVDDDSARATFLALTTNALRA